MSAPADELRAAFERVRAVVAASPLPGVEESTWFRTPSLKVHGKSMLRVKDPDTLVIMCPLEEKEMLMEAAPEIYFETDHYKGWPAVLVRLSKIGKAELRTRIEGAWRMRAPKRLIAAYDNPGKDPAPKSGPRRRRAR